MVAAHIANMPQLSVWFNNVNPGPFPVKIICKNPKNAYLCFQLS